VRRAGRRTDLRITYCDQTYTQRNVDVEQRCNSGASALHHQASSDVGPELIHPSVSPVGMNMDWWCVS
jgi:hypothetical protein